MGCAQSLFKTDGDIEALYTLDKCIGQGVEGFVYLATCISTGDKVAIKMVKRGPDLGLGPEKVRREIQLQARLSHVNIVELKQVILTRRNLGIVMSYVAGGDLHTYCMRYKLDETVARYFFRQIVEGLSYCHASHIAHRDLKLSNFLVTTDKPPRLKLADFGCARKWDTGKAVPKQRLGRFRTFAGTPAYMSPQVLQSAFYPTNTYDAVEADVWALGIVLCHLFFGAHTPFWLSPNAFRNEGMTMQARIAAMKEENWVDSDEFVKANATNLSPELRDLLDKIFIPDEHKRITMQGIKEHPWFNLPLPPFLQDGLDDMAAEQAMRDSLERATVSLAANRHDIAEPSTGNFATIDLIVDLAQKTGKMPGGSAEKVFCLDMAHMDLGPLSQTETATTTSSPAGSPLAAAATAGNFFTAAPADGTAAAGADPEGTNHSAVSYASSLARAASVGDRSNHLTQVVGAPQLTTGRFKKTLSLKASNSGLLVGRYVLEASADSSGTADPSGDTAGVFSGTWLSTVAPNASSLKKVRSVHAGRVFFDEASQHASRKGSSGIGGEWQANKTVHGGTEHAARQAALKDSKGQFYEG